MVIVPVRVPVVVGVKVTCPRPGGVYRDSIRHRRGTCGRIVIDGRTDGRCQRKATAIPQVSNPGQETAAILLPEARYDPAISALRCQGHAQDGA